MQVQLLNTVEHPGPIIPFLNYDNDGLRGTKGQRTGVLRRRIIRVRKSLLPRLEVGEIPERDLAKKVCSGARNPRFRDDAAPLERFWLVLKEVTMWSEISGGRRRSDIVVQVKEANCPALAPALSCSSRLSLMQYAH